MKGALKKGDTNFVEIFLVFIEVWIKNQNFLHVFNNRHDKIVEILNIIKKSQFSKFFYQSHKIFYNRHDVLHFVKDWIIK